MAEVNCIFCKIIKGEIPSYKLYEDKDLIVILDAFPSTKGQSLIISKKHEPYIFNLEENLYNKMFLKAKEAAKAIDKSLKSIRTCIIVEGFMVPHVHIRLHPCYKTYLELAPMKERPSDSEFKEIQEKIKRLL